jgi:MerR family transcriptional regulator, light-induced transcriptional regulator
MPRSITPKQLADAIGVSESSLKRWADAGKVTVSRTGGGHRRITLTEAVRFIRDTKATVVDAELLGLPTLSSAGSNALTTSLMNGDTKVVISTIIARFLAGDSIAAICDGPLRAALTHIGNLWRHDGQGVMVEHRATSICIELLATLKSLVKVPDNAPCAVGGAPSADPYMLPSMMCDAALAEAGFRTVNLGPETPLAVIGQAAAADNASVVWLSFSASPDADIVAAMPAFAEQILNRGASLVLGGRYRELFSTLPTAVRFAGAVGELIAIAEEHQISARAS